MLANGAWLRGEVRIAGGKLTVGNAGAPIDQVVVARWNIAASAILDQGLILANGDLLGGALVNLQAGQIEFAADHLGTLKLPLAQVHAVVLAPQPLTALGIETATGIGARFINGDQLVGTASFINDQAVGINNGKRIVEVARDRIALVRLAASAPAAGKGAIQHLRLAGGDLISGRLKSIDDRSAEIETTYGTFKLPAGLISTLWSEGDALTPLSTLTPQVRQVGQFDERFPFRADHSLSGGFLTMAGKRAERGLGCHARCELSFPLDGSFAGLVGEAGVDAVTGERGNLGFQVFLDGKPAFNVAAKGGEAGRTFAVPLAGAKLLQLVVDFGADGAASGDHGDWCWPVLVKGVTPVAQSQ